MALSDFLQNCHCILESEKQDFQCVLNGSERIGQPFVGYMPTIEIDFEPIYLLNRPETLRFTGNRPQVYFLTLGAHPEYTFNRFSQILEKWYLEDELPDGARLYGAELEETILLRSDDVRSSMPVRGIGDINAFYSSIYIGSNLVYLIGLTDDSDLVWKNIMEKYKIRADILIDAHKGLGNWLEEIPLYPMLLNTPYPELRPKYYFKGEYISHDAPVDFSLIYSAPMSELASCATKIRREFYLTGWRD